MIPWVTGFVYETEDAGGSSGFYRFVPNRRNRLHEGGRLFMLKVMTSPLANLGASYPNGVTFPVDWVEIGQPDTISPTMPANFVWAQGRAQGAATFGRLEGCWHGNDRKIYIASTSGGAGQGQIWVYDPREETITLRPNGEWLFVNVQSPGISFAITGPWDNGAL